MKNKIKLFLISLLLQVTGFAKAQNDPNQIILLNGGALGGVIFKLGESTMPQYGFLPGQNSQPILQ